MYSYFLILKILAILVLFQNFCNSFIRLSEKIKIHFYLKLKSIACLKLLKNKGKVN